MCDILSHNAKVTAENGRRLCPVSSLLRFQVTSESKREECGDRACLGRFPPRRRFKYRLGRRISLDTTLVHKRVKVSFLQFVSAHLLRFDRPLFN
jgi:hypothetical protein